jgi:D-alanyl-D-alanine carboxypeptidase (penicillin-binding protein 5/6)
LSTSHDPSGGLDGLAELMDHEQIFPDRQGRQIDPAIRRRRRRRGWLITGAVIAVILMIGGGYVGWALTAPLDDPVGTHQSPTVPVPAAAVIALPSEGASAIAIAGADEYLGEAAGDLWVSTGAVDEPRPIASISKLITALVILDAKPLTDAADRGPTVTFDKADHDLYDKYYVMGATIAAMPTGSSMSLRDALATMLIPSACNYAEALADWAFGSQRAFVDATTRWLSAHGLTHTTIVEPTGIDARNTSTPGDLLALGRLAAADPVIAQIVAMPSLSLPGPGGMNNTNTLLGSDGITGLKTGTLGAGFSNLLYSATLDVGAAQPLTVVGVQLGGASKESVNRSVLALLDSVRNGFLTVELAAEGQEVGTYTTPWGSGARLVLGDGASIFTWSDTPITLTMDLDTPTAWKDGEVVGSVTWTAGPNTVSVPVELEGGIRPPTQWWRLTHPGELG